MENLTGYYGSATIGVLTGVLGFLLVIFQKSRGPLYNFPGPWISKWTGLFIEFHWRFASRTQYVQFLHKQYGPVVRLSPHEVDISEIEATKTILKAKGGFLKSPWYQTLLPKGVENMFNTSNPEFHSRHRRHLSSPLSDTGLRLMEPKIEERVKLAIHNMKMDLQTHGVTDVYKWWLYLATDIITELSFGQSFRMLEDGEETQFIADLKAIGSVEWLLTSFPNMMHLISRLPRALAPKKLSQGRRTTQVAVQLVQDYKRRLAQAVDLPLALFTKLYNAGENGLSDAEIIGEAFSFIIAGSDTTASTLTYLVWSVCRNPEIKQGLHREVCTLPDHFTDQDVRRLQYLSQVTEETLRLYPAAPSGLKRIVPKGGPSLAGFQIPEGITVSTQAYSVHRDPMIFPEPERFDPSRWAEPTKAMKDAFLSFGGGSRICIGLHLARRELRLATAYFFRNFPNAQVSTRDGMNDDVMEMDIRFLVAPKGRRCLIECPPI